MTCWLNETHESSSSNKTPPILHNWVITFDPDDTKSKFINIKSLGQQCFAAAWLKALTYQSKLALKDLARNLFAMWFERNAFIIPLHSKQSTKIPRNMFYQLSNVVFKGKVWLQKSTKSHTSSHSTRKPSISIFQFKRSSLRANDVIEWNSFCYHQLSSQKKARRTYPLIFGSCWCNWKFCFAARSAWFCGIKCCAIRNFESCPNKFSNLINELIRSRRTDRSTTVTTPREWCRTRNSPWSSKRKTFLRSPRKPGPSTMSKVGITR